MNKEQWLPVEGFDGYQASSLGRVRSIDRIITTSGGTPRNLPGVILTQSLARTGRYQVTLCRYGKKYPTPVHKIVATTFFGPKPTPKHEVCHNDGDPLNNQVNNLRWDTKSENRKDRIRHGTDHNLNKTHCPRNHPYTEENTYIVPSTGARMCRICKRAESKRGWLKLKEKNHERRKH